MVKALIGLGANLGDLAENLNAAADALAGLPDTTLLARSDWMETAAVGGPDQQSRFLNGAVLLDTSLKPAELFHEVQRIEQTLGRTRVVRWGPRQIDLDIVLYGDETVDSHALSIPHPWMAMRRFVLQPAALIAPDMVHPKFGWTVRRLFDNLCQKPSRIEITGLPSVDTTAVAQWLLNRLEGVAAFPEASTQWHRQAVWQLADSPSLAHALELLADWTTEQLPSLPPTEDVVVSDRWSEEILVSAKSCLSPEDFRQLTVAWHERRQSDRQRTLLIVLTSTDGARDAVSNEFWRRVQSPGHGPWLVLDTTDRERLEHDLIAAVTGMR